jgi:hypothetical protein
LNSSDPDLAKAALRCLLVLREFKRIQSSVLNSFISSSDLSLSSCAYVALAVLACEGFFPPLELFEGLVGVLESDRRAELAIIGCCRQEGLAGRIIEIYSETPPEFSECLIKILLCCARHHGLRASIRNFIADWGSLDKLAHCKEAVESLLKAVG